jgi:hypothetical protein
MDSYEMWWENLVFITLAFDPWYPKLTLDGLIELFLVLVSNPNLGNLARNN